MDTKDIKEQLEQARRDLTELEAETPNFERLLADNQADELKLRQSKTALSDIAAAKGRVNVAGELLDQHHSDVQTARAEVNRLEATITRQKKQQELDRLIARQKNLQADWTSKAASITGALITSLEALHDLECKAGPLRRELEVAARELGVETPDRPAFPFKTVTMAEHEAYPEGYYGVTFNAGGYRVLIDPRRDSQQDRA